MKGKVGIAVVASILGLSGSITTVYADTQTQNQIAQSSQQQSVVTTGSNHVGESQTTSLNSSQSQLAPQDNISSVTTSSNEHNATIQESTQTTVTGAGTVTQSQGVAFQSSQSQKHVTTQSQQYVQATLVVSGSEQTQNHSTQLSTSTSDNSTTFTNTDSQFYGYAVFDLSGNMISDAYGNDKSSTVSNVNNATGHFDNFVPNSPTVLIIKAVDQFGHAIINPALTNVNLTSNNGLNTMTLPDSSLPISSITIPEGSSGVTFVYTNQANSAQYDIIDAKVPSHHRQEKQAETQNLSLSSSQNQSVESLTDESFVTANESQATGQLSEQSQSAGNTNSQSASQFAGENSSQQQQVTTSGKADMQQNQQANVQSSQSQTANIGSPSDASGSGTMNIQLSQAQQGQATSPILASQSQQVSFAPTLWMRVDLNQSQGPDQSGNIQSEQINVQLSGTPADTSSPQSGAGTLQVYLNGSLQGTYSCSPGAITVNESQTTTTGDSASTQNQASLKYQQGDSEVEVSLE